MKSARRTYTDRYMVRSSRLMTEDDGESIMPVVVSVLTDEADIPAGGCMTWSYVRVCI